MKKIIERGRTDIMETPAIRRAANKYDDENAIHIYRFTKSESSFDFADTDPIQLGLRSADYDRAPINWPISSIMQSQNCKTMASTWIFIKLPNIQCCLFTLRHCMQ